MDNLEIGNILQCKETFYRWTESITSGKLWNQCICEKGTKILIDFVYDDGRVKD